jgi:signal transduction histidine kinase
MQSLLRDLLDYGNLTAGQLEPLSLAALMRRCVGGCKNLAARMGAGLEVEVMDDVEVVANPSRLVRALENLVENAIQHSPQEGTVRLRLSACKDGGAQVFAR